MEPVRKNNINRTEPIIEPRPHYPMSSFRNLGGTCPLNSVLICLLATKKLINFFKDDSWKNKIRVDLKTVDDKIDKKMKDINKETMTNEDIEEYIKKSVSDHFVCIIKNYFVKPAVLISPVKFCDTMFNKSSIYNYSKRTPFDMTENESVCSGGSGNSLNEYKYILWNMINETCYHVEDGEFAMKTIYNVMDYSEYEKLDVAEKNKILKQLNVLNEIIYVKANILNSETLQFRITDSRIRKKSSILEMFGVYEKEIINCGCIHDYTHFKVTAELFCYNSNLKKKDIINIIKHDHAFEYPYECSFCRKRGIIRKILLSLSNIFVLHISFTTGGKHFPIAPEDIEDLLFEDLDLTDCVAQSDHDYKYKAYAIVQFTIGHYRSFAKYNDTWIVFDDDYVKKLDEISFINEIIRYGIYMLFLERV